MKHMLRHVDPLDGAPVALESVNDNVVFCDQNVTVDCC